MRSPNNDQDLEKIVNESLGLSATKRSGGLHNDGDGKGRLRHVNSWSQLLIDCKFSEKAKKSTGITFSMFDKTNRSARRHGRMPAMATYNPGSKRVYVHADLEDFARIYKNHLKYLEGEDHV